MVLFLLLSKTVWETLGNPVVTGQWDFKFGDLRATIGADLQYFGTASTVTTFPSVNIDGSSSRVMAFGGNSPTQGFLMRHGALANGGGHFVNQYTLVMDVMYPAASSGQWRALFQTNPFNDPGNDAEFYVGNNATLPTPNGVGANGQFDGIVASNIWCRIAFVVDLTGVTGPNLTKYLNGAKVGSQSLPGGIDGQYALGPTALLFTTGLTGSYTQPGFVSSIQFWDGPLAASDIAAFGGASYNGIPPAKPTIRFVPAKSQDSAVKLTWNGRSSLSLNLQEATNLTAPIWQSLGTLNSVRSLALPSSIFEGREGFFRVGDPELAAIEPGIPVEADIDMTSLPYPYYCLPTKQIMHAAGQAVQYNGQYARPLDMVLSPDGQTLYVKNVDGLVVIDVPSWTVLARTFYPDDYASIHGLVTTADGTHVYVTSATDKLYDWSVSSARAVSLARTIDLPAGANPCGLALSRDENTAYVCLGISNTLAVVNLTNGTLTRQINVGMAPYAVALSSDGATAYVSDWAGRFPTNGDLTQPELQNIAGNQTVVVDARGIATSGALSFVDLNQNREVAELPTGLHPSDVKLSADGASLYVANANSDTVTVIDTQTKSVRETILMRLGPTLPVGSASSALAFSVDGKLLYVANGGNNAVGVVQLPNAQHTNSLLQGFIPADWYPSAVLADSNFLYVADANGVPGVQFSAYFLGTLNKIPIPSIDTLSKYTAEVQENGRVPQMLQTQVALRTNQVPIPVPTHVGEPSVFKHVLYIIKENKTYDQVFGDISQGNGDPDLCVFPQSVTPNHHALATQYVLLDNFYCNGIQSSDGHYWVTEANNSDYMIKGYNSYPRGSEIGRDPMYYTSGGFIWDNVLNHGLTFTNFGEFGESFPQPSGTTWLGVWADYTNHTSNITYTTYLGNYPVLPLYSSTNVSGFNEGIPDQVRAANFLTAFNVAQSNGVWPTFSILYLPGDHTAGATPGFPTPSAQVADNDLALGNVVQAVTQSVFGSNTVIFVVEDDPLGGYDHVDGHRSLCLVISPYTKRGQTVSTFYNQIGVIHTMEQIMGLPPMNQMDAIGPLMTDCFMNQPSFTPYTALSNNIPLDTMNPGTFATLKAKDRYWARQSQKQDFSKPDLADEDMLSRIIWHSIKGNARYPSEYAGFHGKGLKKLGLISSKAAKDDDD